MYNQLKPVISQRVRSYDDTPGLFGSSAMLEQDFSDPEFEDQKSFQSVGKPVRPTEQKKKSQGAEEDIARRLELKSNPITTNLVKLRKESNSDPKYYTVKSGKETKSDPKYDPKFQEYETQLKKVKKECEEFSTEYEHTIQMMTDETLQVRETQRKTLDASIATINEQKKQLEALKSAYSDETQLTNIQHNLKIEQHEYYITELKRYAKMLERIVYNLIKETNRDYIIACKIFESHDIPVNTIKMFLSGMKDISGKFIEWDSLGVNFDKPDKTRKHLFSFLLQNKMSPRVSNFKTFDLFSKTPVKTSLSLNASPSLSATFDGDKDVPAFSAAVQNKLDKLREQRKAINTTTFAVIATNTDEAESDSNEEIRGMPSFIDDFLEYCVNPGFKYDTKCWNDYDPTSMFSRLLYDDVICAYFVDSPGTCRNISKLNKRIKSTEKKTSSLLAEITTHNDKILDDLMRSLYVPPILSARNKAASLTIFPYSDDLLGVSVSDKLLPGSEFEIADKDDTERKNLSDNVDAMVAAKAESSSSGSSSEDEETAPKVEVTAPKVALKVTTPTVNADTPATPAAVVETPKTADKAAAAEKPLEEIVADTVDELVVKKSELAKMVAGKNPFLVFDEAFTWKDASQKKMTILVPSGLDEPDEYIRQIKVVVKNTEIDKKTIHNALKRIEVFKTLAKQTALEKNTTYSHADIISFRDENIEQPMETIKLQIALGRDQNARVKIVTDIKNVKYDEIEAVKADLTATIEKLQVKESKRVKARAKGSVEKDELASIAENKISGLQKTLSETPEMDPKFSDDVTRETTQLNEILNKLKSLNALYKKNYVMYMWMVYHQSAFADDANVKANNIFYYNPNPFA